MNFFNVTLWGFLVKNERYLEKFFHLTRKVFKTRIIDFDWTTSDGKHITREPYWKNFSCRSWVGVKVGVSKFRIHFLNEINSTIESNKKSDLQKFGIFSWKGAEGVPKICGSSNITNGAFLHETFLFLFSSYFLYYISVVQKSMFGKFDEKVWDSGVTEHFFPRNR